MLIDHRLVGLLSALALTISSAALAQSYPSKPVRIVVPFAASGTGTDLVARIAAEFITTKTGQSVVVENRGGAGGNLGMDLVAKASPDGTTLGMALATNVVVNPHIYKTMPFDALKDLLPVAPVVATSQLIVVNDDFPAKTLQELIARAKAEPGKIAYASAGVGTIAHLGAHAFAQQAGLELVHVPYRGIGQAVGDVVAGTVPMMSVSVGPVLGALQAKKLRVLAVATPKRLAYLPDVPTAAEAGLPGFELSSWFGIFAPGGTSKEIVATVSGWIQDMLKDPTARKRLGDNHLDPLVMSPEEFGRFVAADHARWKRIVETSGVPQQ